MSSLEASKLFSCQGLVAFITGGGSGLGAYTAKALDANGAKAVYILGRRKESLDKVVKECPNGSVRAIVGDVTSKESLQAAAAQVEKEVGYINVLFANSGIIGQSLGSKLPKEASVQQFQETMWEQAESGSMQTFTNTLHVNVTGAYFTAIAFLALLDAGNKKANVPQKSQIVTTTSVAGVSRLLATGFDYSASKAALIHLTKMLSTAFARYKIRANTIAPGFYISEMTQNASIFVEGKNPTEEGGVAASMAPLERAGGEEDFAGAILYLFSPAGSFVNGNVILTDGGRVSTLPAVY